MLDNSRPRFRTTEFTLADSLAIQQTRQSIVQCKPSFSLLLAVNICQYGQKCTDSITMVQMYV